MASVSLTSSGIDFSDYQTTSSGTTTSELFDHYEEGTFTFTIRGSSGTAGSWAQTNTVGKYRKVGGISWFAASGYLTNKGDYGGNYRIHGLPFTCNYACALSISMYPSTSVDAVWRGGLVDGSTTECGFRGGSRMDVVALYSEIVTGYTLGVSGSYSVA
jgi:hypothetical protein